MLKHLLKRLYRKHSTEDYALMERYSEWTQKTNKQNHCLHSVNLKHSPSRSPSPSLSLAPPLLSQGTLISPSVASHCGACDQNCPQGRSVLVKIRWSTGSFFLVVVLLTFAERLKTLVSAVLNNNNNNNNNNTHTRKYQLLLHCSNGQFICSTP